MIGRHRRTGMRGGLLPLGLSPRPGTALWESRWAHLPDPATPLEETVAAFDELASAGTVGRLGCSNYPVWQLERARHIARADDRMPFTAVQQHHTYLQPRSPLRLHPDAPVRFDAVTDEMLHHLESHPDMTRWSYTSLLGGSYSRSDKPLADKYDHPGTVASPRRTRRGRRRDRPHPQPGRARVADRCRAGGHADRGCQYGRAARRGARRIVPGTDR